ncbi:MAG: hypothetical protein AAB958_00630 [Patescibacteria group bacterium]
MIQEILPKIKNKRIILFGEIHGTKEIPIMLSNFFKYLAKYEDFNLCLELSKEFQDIKLEDILPLAKKIGTSGLISGEYIELIKEMPGNVKVFFIAPNTIKNQGEMEKGLAENILKLINGKRTFAILGNIHASKNRITLRNLDITPAGFLIKQKIKDKMYSILFKAKGGEFFNNGIKRIEYNKDDSFDKNFDYIYELERVSPCSL